jgi:hypothetical protein
VDKRRLFTIFAVVFVDVLGFGLILPLLPYYATRFGVLAGTLCLGLVPFAWNRFAKREAPFSAPPKASRNEAIGATE